MRALSEWRKYLHDSPSPFEIFSDHKNLQYFMTSQKLNRRQARWSLELSEFNFKLIHKPGSSMICSDALSRRPDYDTGTEDNDNITVLSPSHICRAFTEYEPNLNSIVENIRLHANINLDTYNKKLLTTWLVFL